MESMSVPSRSNRTAGRVRPDRDMDTNEPSGYHPSHARTSHARGQEVPHPTRRRRRGARRDHDGVVLRVLDQSAARKDATDVRRGLGRADADRGDDADEEDQAGEAKNVRQFFTTPFMAKKKRRSTEWTGVLAAEV